MITSIEDGTSFDYHFYLKHKSYKNLIQLENEIREMKFNLLKEAHSKMVMSSVKKNTKKNFGG